MPAAIDGTALLEKILAAILKAYLGSGNSRTYMISNRGANFRHKVNTLCDDLGEGARFRNFNAEHVHAQNAGIDVVGWIPFENRVFEQ